ncbi:MAG TPA: peptidoglycan DD-metalloendopeptidase family protein [Candidatus Limnocylindrales bacterium]|nr:peptidoglycan DD-metalloendopeptidase family protein [Candidatus Limnocylindrales bacterium]
MKRHSLPTEGWSGSRTPKPRRRVRRLSFVLLVPLLFGALGSPAAPVAPVAGDELADAKAKQAALDKQIRAQKAAVAEINAMQANLGSQIASTKRELANINADLVAVRKSIDAMVVKIEAVKKQYFALVARLQLLDNQLANLVKEEARKRSELGDRKAQLAERIREAYSTDRTTLLETFLAGGTFTDVISEVGYINDFAEQDRELAEQIVAQQKELVAIHAMVDATRGQTETLRVETARQKAELDRQLEELKVAQARLKELEKETARALATQKAAYAQLARNKKDLARAIASNAAAQNALAKRIDDLVAKQFAAGNIPSKFNGSLQWPLSGKISGEFGCSSYPGYGPGYGCEHFHNGIDIVAPSGCGAPIKAAGDGRIGYVGWNYADGADPAWIVIIVHSQNLQTWYAHMKPLAPDGIRAGAAVQTGQVIGYEGNTGNSTGCHLHWMVEYNGTWKNPRLFI